MTTDSIDFALVMFISLQLLLLKHETHAVSEQIQANIYDTLNSHTSICHNGFMSVYISKMLFADLPFTVYVHETHDRYYQVVAIAKHCNYFIGESDSFVILTVASNGCFVRRQKHVTSLTVVIVAPADKDKVKIVRTIPLICETKEANKMDHPPESRQHFCSEDGFNITIVRNAAIPPLNLDDVWIPSGRSQNCEPKATSTDAVTFSFSFTDCGAQSAIAGGILTYWVNIEGKKQMERGTIYRDAPFHLTVQCSFALAQESQLSIELQREKYASTLKSKGLLRTEMRFAKDSSYTSFYPSRDHPTLMELGQPVYVEISILKHQDKDLVLLLEECWATPTHNPHDSQRWNLLTKGCPFTGDTHRTAVLPVVSSKEVKYPSHYKRFVVRMFSFVKPQTSDNLVYFHCHIKICKGPECLQSCKNGGRKSRSITSEPSQRILNSVVSGGPLHYYGM